MRRRAAVAILPLLALPWRPPHAAGAPVRLVAAWALGRRWQAGWLRADGDALAVEAAIDLPTRAHGLWLDEAGRLLVVARRPGDWLLRWDGRDASAAQWHWMTPGRQFNGHAVTLGGRVLTTETDLETGEGRIGVRDAATLRLQGEWPTGGRDPHQLLPDADGRGLWVANGGLETRPETGRAKLALDTMDASLVRLDADGRTRDRWTVDDARLSIRHLARTPDGGVAVAMQAEHDDPAERLDAPVLALCDGRRLRAVAAPRPLGGYGGDVSVDLAPGGGGVVRVSCPRAPGGGGIARWDLAGRWLGFDPLPEANALAGDWAGGHPAARHDGAALALPGLRLDNHWRAA